MFGVETTAWGNSERRGLLACFRGLKAAHAWSDPLKQGCWACQAWVQFSVERKMFAQVSGVRPSRFCSQGFMLTTYDHRKIAYSQWWTSGNGVDCGYHNHQARPFMPTHGPNPWQRIHLTEAVLAAYCSSDCQPLQYSVRQAP